MAELTHQRLPSYDCRLVYRSGIDGLSEPRLHALEVDVLGRACAVARRHERVAYFPSVKAKLADVV